MNTTTLPAPQSQTRVDLPQPVALPYHRAAHLSPSGARWWRPLAVTALTLPLYLAVSVPLAIAMVLLTMFVPGMPQPTPDLENARNPIDLLTNLGLLALLIPAVLLAVRLVGGRGETRGTLHSVTGRLRWSLLFKVSAAVFVFYGAVWGGFSLFAEPLHLPALAPSLIAAILVILLVTPFQAAAEEYVFRGLLPQAVGTWLRSPVWGIVLPTVVFLSLHEYSWIGQIDIAVFSLCAGFLAWKTGGLEVPIAMHAVNNLYALAIVLLTTGSLAQGEVPLSALALSLPPTLIVTAVVTVWVSRREGLGLLQPVRGVGHATN